jgi:phosphate starvation-inducible PhoH-like protein
MNKKVSHDNKISLYIDDHSFLPILFGENDKNIAKIEEVLQVEISMSNNMINIFGDSGAIELGKKLVEGLEECYHKGFTLTEKSVEEAAQILRDNHDINLIKFLLEPIIHNYRNKPVVPKTISQKGYIEIIQRFDVVFSLGPAGTGKTYLAMAMAIQYLQKQRVDRIILTRPVRETGERLGFLPGTLYEKINPYLQPLYDALHDMVGSDKAIHMIEKGVIEVAPLAFMRGRTLNDSFIILDEAQNTTQEQMKMFLTRLGQNSKAIITGDTTQTDLTSGRESGLIEAIRILQDVPEIGFARLTHLDVVRHTIVKKIIRAYERLEKRNK